MNNLSYESYLVSTAAYILSPEEPTMNETVSGTLPEDFSIDNDTEQHQSAELEAGETVHAGESAFSNYKPVGYASIIPVHQLLF